MSDVIDEAVKQLEKLAAHEKRKKELAEKQLYLNEIRVNNDMERVNRNIREMDAAKNANYGSMSDEDIKQVQENNTQYLIAARKCMRFINDEFQGLVPYFRQNLILLGAKTGEGKSTAVANIVATTLSQTSKVTEKRCRVLVITNEEARESVYNRITCFAKGWHYVNHHEFTDDQIKAFSDAIPLLAPNLTVIDDTYGSTPDNPISGVTTSIEGICSIFDNLIATGTHYDSVVIDYFQNINKSKKTPGLDGWGALEELGKILDRYKNTYSAPIILLAQVKPADAENTVQFKDRIEGRKSIINQCTMAIEIIANKSNLTTEWVIHKSRFNESGGLRLTTGYDMGRFVPLTPEFKAKTAKYIEKRKAEKQDKEIGIHLKKESKE